MTRIKLSSIKADLDRETAGDWIEYPKWPGVAFCVSSLFAPGFAAARDAVSAKLARKHSGRAIPADELARENGRLYCQHILHDWRGLADDDGEEIQFDIDTAREILCDPAYRELIAAVEWCAAEAGRIQAEFVEEREKNSARPSGGDQVRKAGKSG